MQKCCTDRCCMDKCCTDRCCMDKWCMDKCYSYCRTLLQLEWDVRLLNQRQFYCASCCITSSLEGNLCNDSSISDSIKFGSSSSAATTGGCSPCPPGPSATPWSPSKALIMLVLYAKQVLPIRFWLFRLFWMFQCWIHLLQINLEAMAA